VNYRYNMRTFIAVAYPPPMGAANSIVDSWTIGPDRKCLCKQIKQDKSEII